MGLGWVWRVAFQFIYLNCRPDGTQAVAKALEGRQFIAGV